MGMPETEQKVINLPNHGYVNQPQTTYEERFETNLTKEEMAERYHQWRSTHKPKSDYDRAFDAVRHLMPDWFLFSALIVGVITLGMIMLKVNPLLEPVKRAVLWLLDFWEAFLRKTLGK